MSESNSKGKENGSIEETVNAISETEPFSSLNKMLEENPEFKSTFDSVMSILGDNDSENISAEDAEVECVEIDGKDYIIARRYEIAGHTYLYLINADDVMDFIIQKKIMEDGEEYVVGLDSEKEFDLVQAYIQRDFMMQLKNKINKKSEKPDNQ